MTTLKFLGILLAIVSSVVIPPSIPVPKKNFLRGSLCALIASEDAARESERRRGPEQEASFFLKVPPRWEPLQLEECHRIYCGAKDFGGSGSFGDRLMRPWNFE